MSICDNTPVNQETPLKLQSIRKIKTYDNACKKTFNDPRIRRSTAVLYKKSTAVLPTTANCNVPCRPNVSCQNRMFGAYCFADDLAFLSSNKSDLQYAFDWFSDACLDAGMKISAYKLHSVTTMVLISLYAPLL